MVQQFSRRDFDKIPSFPNHAPLVGSTSFIPLIYPMSTSEAAAKEENKEDMRMKVKRLTFLSFRYGLWIETETNAREENINRGMRSL